MNVVKASGIEIKTTPTPFVFLTSKGRPFREQVVPHICAKCREGNLGSYVVGQLGDRVLPFQDWHRGTEHPRLTFEPFEGRDYLRVKCNTCPRNEKVPLEKYDPSTDPIYV